MTRATRSGATQQQNEKEKPQGETPKRAAGTKKRKRTSVAENAEQPASKIVRTQDGVKEEGSPEPTDEHGGEAMARVELPSSGDVPLSPEDAEQILDVLEMMDTQGLLDRIFPLPTEHKGDSESAAGPSTSTQSFSFRTLLKSPSDYPLRVLRSAVKHLFPISSHPRSRASTPAMEQLRFCRLALSLLDQASCHQAPASLDVPSLIPPSRAQQSADTITPNQSSQSRSTRKYALVQHLPTGDWWSSLNSANTLLPDGKDLKDLPTSYAELVAVLPSASTSEPPPDSQTLGQYVKKRTYRSLMVPQQRLMPCGSFLDYGPYATFAPTFEQNGVEIGRERLSEVVWFKERDKQRRARVQAYREQLIRKKAAHATSEEAETETHAVEPGTSNAKQKETPQTGDVEELEGLLTSEQIADIKSALGSLEVESAVSELLERNARALDRLEALQLDRLSNPNEASRAVDVDSEEWDTAQNILESLTLLASLRPRSSAHGDAAPLIPPTSTLRKLHRTLPVDSMQGWYGTLPDARQAACRDDNTVRIRTGPPAPTTAPPAAPAPAAATPPAPTPSKPSAPAPAQQYNPYSYSANYPTAYRGGYGNNYYPNYQSPATPSTSTNHYPNHKYTSSGAQPYSAYSSWYNYQPQSQAQAGSSTPSAATPQAAKPSTSFTGYFSNATQQPTPQRAVANTVLSTGAGGAARTWGNGAAAYVAPTMPPHMRPAASASGASAPGSGGYYLGYQPSAATAAASQS